MGVNPIIVEPGRGLDLHEGRALGRVCSVDSERIGVELTEPGVAAAVAVSDLVAVPTGSAFLLGVAAGLTRRAGEGLQMEVMPVGTLSPHAGHGDTFRLGASSLPHIDSPCFLLEGERLAAFMAALGADVAPDEQLVLGHYLAEGETPAIADGNRLLQRHLAVLGNTGSGKSWTVSLLLERAARLRYANVIVLDLHGEYGPLAEPPDGSDPVARRLRLAGPADLLYGGEEELYVPYWLLERDELLTLILNEDDPSAADQRACLSDRIQTLKRSTLAEMGAHEAMSTATVDAPVPYRMSHLLDWLRRDDTEMIIRQPSGRVDPGPYAGKLTGLISRLEARIADPRYGFIFHPPEATESPNWLVDTAEKLLSADARDPGVKTVDLSEVPNAILPLVAGVLGRLIYQIQFWTEPAERTPVCIVCDEAHVYLPSGEAASPIFRVARDAFETIAKEGRKYGVCLAVVSQRPSDVSRTILSQCNNFIVMRLTNDRDQDVVGRLVPRSLTTLTGLLPMLDVGECVVLGDALLLPVRIKLDPPRVAPASATLPYWTLWTQKPSSFDAISAGVASMQTQWRGIE